MARSTARKRALNTLYEADEKGQDILSLLSERLERPGAQTPLPDYAVEIITGVAKNRHDIDVLLDGHSTGWSVSRMAVVDRNILRIAVWEMVYNDEVPDAVCIDEALGLAKTLSDEESPAFIHGLLSAIEADSAARERALEDSRLREKEGLKPAVAESGVDASDSAVDAGVPADSSGSVHGSDAEGRDDATAASDGSIDFDDLVLEDPQDIPTDDSPDDEPADGPDDEPDDEPDELDEADETGNEEGIES